MKIESKSTKAIHFISKADYDKMETYKKRLYVVLDNSDMMIPSIEVKEVKITPKDVFDVDFEAETKKLLEDCTKADIKSLLDEQGLDYKTDDNEGVLAEIYLKWKTKNY